MGAQLSLEHSNDHYTFMTLDEPMINVKHFVFHHCDGSIGMSIVQAYEEVFPSTYLDPFGFNMIIDVGYSL